MGDVVHKFNTSEQYVAPLMADFRHDENTKIHYVDTGAEHYFKFIYYTIHIQYRRSIYCGMGKFKISGCKRFVTF